jgi:CBS domain-containing protein
VRAVRAPKALRRRPCPSSRPGRASAFPWAHLLANRPVTLTYTATGDLFCFVLSHAKFDQLTRRSPAFLDFCTRRLGSLLDLSRQQMQANYAAEASAERTMGMTLAALVRGKPIMCSPDDSLREAFTRMNDAHVGSVIVAEDHPGGEEVLGILTRTDLIGRVILPQLPLDTRIGDVMTRDVMTLDANATAADATLLMAEHSIRHIPVVQSRGGVNRVIGVVSERDLFACNGCRCASSPWPPVVPMIHRRWPRWRSTSGVCRITWSRKAWRPRS